MSSEEIDDNYIFIPSPFINNYYQNNIIFNAMIQKKLLIKIKHMKICINLVKIK